MQIITPVPVSDFDAAVRMLSGGTNVAIYNDLGLPSIYVRRDKGLISDVIDGGSEVVHPAFKVNGDEIGAFYIGIYLATVYKGRALSLPLQDPAASGILPLDKGDAPHRMVTFDNAKIWCEANGAGFHLATISEYAWLALLSRKNGTMPRGNTLYGVHNAAQYEKGVAADSSTDGTQTTRTLTGSGPATWNDNWKPDGICDLNGNVKEWMGGFRLVDGELQIFQDNDAAMQYAQNADSTLWKAILPDGTLTAPGTSGSLKWDYDIDPGTTSGDVAFSLSDSLQYQQDNTTAYGAKRFQSLTAKDGIIIPERLKALALMPADSGDHGNNLIYMRNVGESLGLHGGDYTMEDTAGIFHIDVRRERNYHTSSVGFRPAFIPGI